MKILYQCEHCWTKYRDVKLAELCEFNCKNKKRRTVVNSQLEGSNPKRREDTNRKGKYSRAGSQMQR